MKLNMKYFQLVLVSVLTAALLVGCGPNNSQNAAPPSQNDTTNAQNDAADNSLPEKPEKLVIWDNDASKNTDITKELAKEYEEKTGIKVEVVPVALLEQTKKLALDGPAGKGADILYLPHGRIGDSVLQGLIKPIELDEELKQEFTPASIEAFTYEGQLYGIPRVTESIALVYNKDLMETPPATFDELIAFAKDFTVPDEKKYGFIFESTNFYYVNPLIQPFGSYVFNMKDGLYHTDDIGLNNAGAVKGMEMVRDWHDSGLIPQGVTGDVVNGLFGEQKVAAVINGPWSIAGYKEKGINVGVAPLPKLSNGEYPQTFVGVKGWFMSNYTKHEYWTLDLMKFLTTKDALLRNYKSTFEIPPRIELMDDPSIKDDPIVSAFALQAARGIATPNIPEMFTVWDPMKNALTFINSGQLDVQPALDEAVEAIKEQISVLKE